MDSIPSAIPLSDISDYSMRILALLANRDDDVSNLSQAEYIQFTSTATVQDWENFSHYSSRFKNHELNSNSLSLKQGLLSATDFSIGLFGIPCMLAPLGWVPAIRISLAALAVITAIDEFSVSETNIPFKYRALDYGLTFVGHLATAALGLGCAYFLNKVAIALTANRHPAFTKLPLTMAAFGPSFSIFPLSVLGALITNPVINSIGNKVLDWVFKPQIP